MKTHKSIRLCLPAVLLAVLLTGCGAGTAAPAAQESAQAAQTAQPSGQTQSNAPAVLDFGLTDAGETREEAPAQEAAPAQALELPAALTEARLDLYTLTDEASLTWLRAALAAAAVTQIVPDHTAALTLTGADGQVLSLQAADDGSGVVLSSAGAWQLLEPDRESFYALFANQGIYDAISGDGLAEDVAALLPWLDWDSYAQRFGDAAAQNVTGAIQSWLARTEPNQAQFSAVLSCAPNAPAELVRALYQKNAALLSQCLDLEPAQTRAALIEQLAEELEISAAEAQALLQTQGESQ